MKSFAAAEENILLLLCCLQFPASGLPALHHKAAVKTVCGYQLVMRALLDDLAMVNNKDPVGIAHRLESVRNHNHSFIAHYVDSFGFTQVPEFFIQREKQLTPDALLTGENIQTPRGSFLVTDMSREQMETAGYGFHHESEDGKYLIMGNGTQAFAVAVEQPQRENPLRTAELSTEQNENMIDGSINNTPPEPQPEEPEQLFFEDVAAGSGQTQEETPGPSLHKRLSATISGSMEPERNRRFSAGKFYAFRAAL